MHNDSMFFSHVLTTFEEIKMKAKLNILASLFLCGCAASAFATGIGGLAAPGSTQFVTIMNNLANPYAREHTKSDVLVKYYDGTGKYPPCWVEYKIEYRKDPNVSGAGGRNACGISGVTPAAIVKVDILPLKSPAGKLYEDLLDVQIDPNKFYTNLIIEQGKAPVYNPDGSLRELGTLKVKTFVDGE